ncbi:dihydrolipoyl dehydrogenase [Halobacillus karajensis]|uniref:Dihydrolipoyl dehydrogenase n=1 Tax=Halobacillus karajensis TaxID=195088 RepID=A0A024P713_9BACI|nr:dihydrolipoyl dehydrogenase [Halobacillus karajensis]CDQ18211.1 Dihydrolipoyl dehydrogenase [Halobacillus karajensis]CDQ24563.1 Dihydrolipoyl dehydrogenase [Halobacillus karajensis]CDQ29190.1 Dihydrolipoyl dehydrogenase [Halobacillus karajensis]
MHTTDVLIIGAGPGGYVAALRAAQFGNRVTIVDKANLGGTCLNVGCIPSKALIEASHYANMHKKAVRAGVRFSDVSVDFQALQDWKNSLVDQLTSGIEGLLTHREIMILQGEASFQDRYTVKVAGEEEHLVSFSSCIIATGSRPVQIPALRFGNRVLTSTEALALQEKPSSLAIIGGGYIGVELGTMFANFGTHVTIFEGMDTILPGFSTDMSSIVFEQLTSRENVRVHTGAKVTSVEQGPQGVNIHADINGSVKQVESDYVLVTVGRKPNTGDLHLENAGVRVSEQGFIPIDDSGRTNHPHIFAIGDITPGPALAHRATLQGKIAVESLNGEVGDGSEYVIPAVVYSDPPLASVGPSEAELVAAGYTVDVHNFPFDHNGRALTLGMAKGFVKLIVDSFDQTILAAEVAGEGAPELVNELAVSIQSGLTPEDVSLVVHAHPTLGESIMEAADKAIGLPVHTL